MHQPPLLPPFNAVAFTRRLGNAMVVAGIRSDRQLAKLAGVHWTRVSRYRKGEVRPSMESLLKIAKALGDRMPDGGADKLPALFIAAGWPPPLERLAGDMPEIVAANADDPAVVKLWRSGVPTEPLLKMLEVYLAWRDSQASERLAGLSGPAACGQVNDRG